MPYRTRCSSTRSGRSRSASARRAGLVLLCVASLGGRGTAVSAQQLAYTNGRSPIGVETNLNGVVERGAPIVISFTRALMPEERTAVFVGETDVTALFERTPDGLVYPAGALPLFEAGEHAVAVYLVAADGTWSRVHEQNVQVPGVLGFVQHEWDPTVTLEFSRTLDQGIDPDPGFDEELRAQISGSIGLRSSHAHGSSTYFTEATILGVEDRRNALRFGELQSKAPKFDLSSYRVRGQNGPLEFELGHVSHGNQRHLVSGIASRGATLQVGGDRVSASVAAMGGSRVVGWDDLFGVGNSNHRMFAGSVALDAFSTPGKLQLEVHGLAGSVLPRVGFNAGEIVDAEKSHGMAGSMRGAFFAERLRFDLGLAQSTFDNPADPFLEQGFQVVPVTEETNYARYAEASLDVLRGLPIGAGRRARLTLGARHENVDPLYRSLGAFTSADQRSEAVDVQADVAGVGAQLSLGTSRNNLNDIPSILTTETRLRNANVRLPLAQVVGSTTRWLPSINGQWSRTHQLGLNVPVDGGFSPSHIPDQVSVNTSASVDWRFDRVGWGLRWNRSHQDNRQEGRENADFEVETRGLNLSLNPVSRISASLDVGLERSTNHERDETDETLRFGGSVNLMVFSRSSLSLQYSDTETKLLGFLRNQRSSTLNLSWSSYVPDLGPMSGQYFLRFARSTRRFLDPAFAQDERGSDWTLDLGVNVSLY